MLNFNVKEDKFHTMFSEAASNVNEAAIVLRCSFDSLEDKDSNVNKIEELEEKGARLVNNVVKELNEAFITPIDREDIYSIVKEMDNILDLINSTMHRFSMFDIKVATESSKRLGDLVVEATNEIIMLMNEIKHISKKNSISKHIININKIEANGDFLFRKTVADLFKNEVDPITIIKWKEIYQILEDTIDSCQKVANIVEGVVMKNA